MKTIVENMQDISSLRCLNKYNFKSCIVIASLIRILLLLLSCPKDK